MSRAAAALASLPVWRGGSTDGYRSRVVYGDFQAIETDQLGTSTVRASACCIAQWVSQKSRMPGDFFRDATVRVSRAGRVHIKFVLQMPAHLLHGVSMQGPDQSLETCSTWCEGTAPPLFLL